MVIHQSCLENYEFRSNSITSTQFGKEKKGIDAMIASYFFI